MNESVKELIAIGASVGAHCQPCLEYHIQAAIKLGVEKDDILQAVEVGHAVEKGAMAAMRKFTASAVKDLSDASFQNGSPLMMHPAPSENNSPCCGSGGGCC